MRLLYQNIFLLLSLLMFRAPTIYAQTCSCAGAPLLGSQSLESASKGNLVLGLTYEYNNISDLYNGSDRLNNKTQRRNTMTALLEANYGLTDRLALTGTFTLIRKRRTTGLQNPELSQSLTTSGVGDGLFMLKYVLHKQTLWEPYQVAIGGGAKVPFGTTSLNNSKGLALNADMQPGTGAWDGVVWSFVSKTFLAQDVNVFLMNTFRRTGTNERFNTSDHYRFGNELVSVMGATRPLSNTFSLLVVAQYRSAGSDRLNGRALPNSGGKWVSLKPSLGYQLSNQLSIQLAGQQPVYQHLNGTQPTTSFTLSGSVFFSFNKNDTGFIHGDPNQK